MSSDACILLSADTELTTLRTNFETQFRAFNDFLGEDCSVFGTVSDLLRDASNIANQWEKDLKMAVKNVIDEASKIFDALKGFVGGIVQSALTQIKAALAGATSAFTSIMTAVKDMMGAIAAAANGMKMMMCDAITDGIKLIPPELVVGAVAVGMVKGYNFTKDLNGKNIVGLTDVQKMSTDILKGMGIQGMKDSVLNSSKSVTNMKLPTDLSSFKCLVTA